MTDKDPSLSELSNSNMLTRTRGESISDSSFETFAKSNESQQKLYVKVEIEDWAVLRSSRTMSAKLEKQMKGMFPLLPFKVQSFFSQRSSVANSNIISSWLDCV
jgi:hypothetical protein